MPQWLKLQTEVVNVTEQRYNLHDENLLGWTVWVALTTLLKRSLVAYSLPCSQYIVFVEKLRRTQVKKGVAPRSRQLKHGVLSRTQEAHLGSARALFPELLSWNLL